MGAKVLLLQFQLLHSMYSRVLDGNSPISTYLQYDCRVEPRSLAASDVVYTQRRLSSPACLLLFDRWENWMQGIQYIHAK